MNRENLKSYPRDDLLGFPPGKHFLVLPRRPLRAALGSMALYDTVYLHQEFALHAGLILLRLRLGGLLRLRYEPPLPEPESWWRAWLEDVARPVVGSASLMAFRLLGHRGRAPSRVTMLLLDADGRTLGFAKLHWPPENPPWNNVLATLRVLSSDSAATFRVPGLLAAGTYGNCTYYIQRSMPAGIHRRVRRDPPRLHAVVDELQARLAFLDRPSHIPAHYVPIHGALTPLNLRIAADGQIWLVDWDHVGWGPRLTDELRYWLGDFARRPGLVRSSARQIDSLLRGRGTNDQVCEALEWRKSVRPREIIRAEQQIRDALEAYHETRWQTTGSQTRN